LEANVTSTNQTGAAQKAADARRGFKIHAIVFVIVIALLAVIDWLTAEPYWVQWVFLGWGIGLAAHAWAVFRHRPPA
jgi:hypothetical protein